MFETSDSSINIADMWSSDAYYYDPQDINPEANQNETIELPGEYNPVWTMPDPWFSSSQCKEDFILVAEFSELEGPKPLITIPKEIAGNFDLNDFSVRIMTVDCQSHPSDSFKVHEDTSMVISEAKYGIYAYVHHFTLYDSKARGFVRPFCMAFVTSNMSKLELFYDDIHKEFDTVCWKMRQGNLMVFVKDMTYHLTDLQYTKEKFLESEHQREMEKEIEGQTTGLPNLLELLSMEDSIILQSLSLDSLNSAIKEVKHILQTVNTLIASLDLTPEESEQYGVLVSSTTSYDSQNFMENPVFTNTADLGAQYRYSPCLSSNVQYSSSLGESTFLTEGRTRNRSSTLQRSGSFTHVQEDDVTIMYEPKLVRTTNKRRYDKTLRTLHELCLKSAKKGLNRLRYVQKYFAKDLATLKLEKREAEVLSPNEGLFTLGRNVQMNFLPKAAAVIPMSHSVTFSDVFSDDAASFASAESFLSCDDTSPTKQRVVLSTSLEDLNWYNSESNVEPELQSIASVSDSINSLGSSNFPENDSVSEFCLDPVNGSSERTESGTADTLQNVPSTSDLATSDSVEISQCIDDCNCDGPFKVFSLPDQIHTLGKCSPGYGLLKFMHKYSFAPHLVFSLLCGRPVIVMATKKKEPEIRAVITSLCFLVPGYGRLSSQIQIFTNPLSIQDLSHRLIGLITSSKIPREKQIPKEIEERCTLLDVERKMLYGPCYQGGMVTDIYNRRKNHANDRTYLIHIHSVLSYLCMKAYVFYHTFIMNVSSKLPDMYTNPDEAKLAYEKAEEHFLQHMKMSLHDTIIVKSIAEMVQNQVDSISKNQCSGNSSQSSEVFPKMKHLSSQLFKA